MSKNSAARQKKVESAVRILQTTTVAQVLQAMLLAGFSKIGRRKQNCAPGGKAPLPTKAKQSVRRQTCPNQRRHPHQ
jgi:hypothetical protein